MTLAGPSPGTRVVHGGEGASPPFVVFGDVILTIARARSGRAPIGMHADGRDDEYEIHGIIGDNIDAVSGGRANRSGTIGFAVFGSSLD